MVSYVALLRAVNVGGAKVSMADLKALAVQQGWSEASTYLNSGNLLFDAPDISASKAAQSLSVCLQQQVGRPVPVLVRSPAELSKALDASRKHFPDPDDKWVHLAFLAGKPQGTDLGTFDDEQYVVDGHELHVHYPNGLARSKLTIDLIERKLGVQATIRGRKTVAALVAKSGFVAKG